MNTPYVNNSYKWAGGGFLSTVKDLVKLGNVMLYSFQCANPALSKKKGIASSYTSIIPDICLRFPAITRPEGYTFLYTLMFVSVITGLSRSKSMRVRSKIRPGCIPCKAQFLCYFIRCIVCWCSMYCLPVFVA